MTESTYPHHPTDASVAHAMTTSQACIDACTQCHQTCLSMALNHCLELGVAHVAPAHFRSMVNCATLCRTVAELQLARSLYAARLCGLCAEACSACAADCEAVGDMDACVQACRACAASCRAMASEPQ